MNRFTSMLALIGTVATIASCSKPLTYEDSASVSIRGQVEALDQSSRLVTLRDSSGHSTTYYVSPQVQRLNEVRVGDTVNADYTVSLVGELREPTADEKANPVLVEKTASRASAGSAPSGTTRRKVRVVSTVDAIDLPNMRVTLKGPMGDTTVIRARSSENIRKLRVGDTVVLNYVESSQTSLTKQ